MKEPDKWCIKITPENKEAIEKWRTVIVTLKDKGYCVNKTSFNSMIGFWYPNKPEGYTEISFEEFKVYTSKPKDLTGRYVKCLVDGAQGTKCKAGEIYKLVSLDNIVETQVYKLEDGLSLCISPATSNRWELLPEDYSADKPLKQAVHCTTKKEWDFVLKKLNYEFYPPFNIGYHDTIDFINKKESFKSYYKDHQILSFQEWCDLNGYKMEKEVKFEVGKWYRVTDGTCKAIGKNIWYAKSPKLIDNIIICEEYIHKKINKGGNFGELGEYTFTEVSIEEIQQYLPDGHPNKIKTVQSFEAGKWYKKDGYYLKPKKIIGTNSQCNTEYISPEGKYHANNSGIDDLRTWELLTDLTEIQQYLPDEHPDKIKNDIKFEVGNWVVNLEKSISYNVNEICKVSKISKTHLACENKPQDEGYMKPFDKFRHATPEEIHRHLTFTGQISAGDPINTGINPNINGSFSCKVDNRSTHGIIPTTGNCYNKDFSTSTIVIESKLLLSTDDDDLPMVNISEAKTIKTLLNND